MYKEEIIQSIEDHLTKSQKQYYSDFYIGITDNISERLFTYHRVNRTTDWWIYCKADNDTIAREVESHFIEKGMDGGSGGGNNQSLYIYCYEINQHTKQRD